eukprot:5155888-Prorocentrum_lima.AAC.1
MRRTSDMARPHPATMPRWGRIGEATAAPSSKHHQPDPTIDLEPSPQELKGVAASNRKLAEGGPVDT